MVAPAGIEPATQGFSVLCSTDWAMVPKKWRFVRDLNPWSPAWQAGVIDHYTNEPFGCGRRIWTYDLWVMSPTSYPCSIPRYINKILMAEKEGFEPPRRFRPPGFQDQSLQPDLGISPVIFIPLQKWQVDYNTHIFKVSIIFYHFLS